MLCLHAQVVCDFCHAHLEKNKAAFESPKLELINDDARTQLEAYPGKFDVIIGDLADPLDGGPCYQLYTQVTAGINQCFGPQQGVM
jgi:thermospermine synthase